MCGKSQHIMGEEKRVHANKERKGGGEKRKTHHLSMMFLHERRKMMMDEDAGIDEGWGKHVAFTGKEQHWVRPSSSCCFPRCSNKSCLRDSWQLSSPGGEQQVNLLFLKSAVLVALREWRRSPAVRRVAWVRSRSRWRRAEWALAQWVGPTVVACWRHSSRSAWSRDPVLETSRLAEEDSCELRQQEDPRWSRESAR